MAEPQVTLREEFATGATVSDVQTFCARAVALGLNGYTVRVQVRHTGREVMGHDTLRSTPFSIASLEVSGPAPDLR